MRQRRSIWDQKETRLAQRLAYYGLTQKTIARACELTKGAVCYRLRKIGVSTIDWRQGTNEYAREVINREKRKLRIYNGREHS